MKYRDIKIGVCQERPGVEFRSLPLNDRCIFKAPLGGVEVDHYKLFIDGEFVEAQNGATFESIDPGTGLPLATVAQAGVADAEAAITAARRAFDHGIWSGLTPQARAEKIYDFADQITQQTLRLAITESMDAGQVIGLAKYWGMLGSQLLRNFAYYAATKFPWEEEIPYSGNVFAPGRDYIRR